MPRLTPQEVKQKEALAGRRLTREENFFPENGLTSRTPSPDLALEVEALNHKPKLIQRDAKEQALLNTKAEAEQQAEQESWKTMTPAQRRVHFSNLGLANYRAQQATDAAMKSHLKDYREQLTALKDLYELALWTPEYTPYNLACIRHAIAQIEVGPDADPSAIRSSYAEAMSATTRIASAADAAARAQIEAAQNGLRDQLARLRVVTQGAANAEPEVDTTPTSEQVLDSMPSYWAHHDRYKAHMALGQRAEASAALADFIVEYNAANPGAKIEERLGLG